MARTFPAALALVVAFTGTSLPAVAAPAQPATTPLASPTTARAATTPASAPKDTGAGWSIPLTGVNAAALASAPAFTHPHDHDSDDDGAHGSTDTLERSTGVDAPEGTLAALSPAATTREFTLAAVSWQPDPADEVTSVAMRVRDGAGWSEWYELGVMASDEADARLGSEPVLAPGADGVQARVETISGRTPSDMRIELVQPGALATDAQVGGANNGNNPLPGNGNGNDPLPGNGNDPVPGNGTEPEPEPEPEPRPKPGAPRDALATGDEIRPSIVTRAQWGADETVARDASRSTTLKAMYVHHTVNSNTYTQAEAPALMRSILRYHAVTLGWPDIGYHFLVDRFGTIYEGRRGSIDELVVGAQAGGYNTDTIGVSAIGNFHPTKSDSAKVKAQKEAPDAMVQAIIDVLAWQSFKWDLKPKSNVRLRTGGSTGSGTRWKVGQLTDKLPALRGHRATNYTACPGDNLEALLPYIRDEVAYWRKMALAAYGIAPIPPAAPAVTALTSAQTPIRLASKIPVRWKAVPGAAKYQVLVRRAAHGKETTPKGGAWRVQKTTTKLSLKLAIPTGSTWTVAVRAVDKYGQTGMATIIGTTTRPVGSAKLVRSKATGKKWKKVTKSSYYRKRAFTTRKKGAKITVKGARDVRQVWIIAPSGPKYGRARLTVGGTTIKTVSFAQSKYTAKRRIQVVLPRAMSGNVVLTTLDKKLVRVSAIALARR